MATRPLRNRFHSKSYIPDTFSMNSSGSISTRLSSNYSPKSSKKHIVKVPSKNLKDSIIFENDSIDENENFYMKYSSNI